MICPLCGGSRRTRQRFMPVGAPPIVMILSTCAGCGLFGFHAPTGVPRAEVAPPRPIPSALAGWALAGPRRLIVPSGVDLTTAAPGIMAALAPADRGAEAVHYWLSLEERLDPVAELRIAAERLSPGGAILITADDAGSPGAGLLGSGWPGWEPGRQRWVFSRETLRLAIERAGLQVTYLRRGWFLGLVMARAELR